jgi:hypothetical protein
MRGDFRNLIVTDIPQPQPHPIEREPLAIDDDITRRDIWLFAPLIAAAVALPLIAMVLFASSAIHLVNSDRSASASAPTTFASRWPDKALPVVR